MVRSVTPFLMFEGRAEEAMSCYVATFASCRILSIARYPADVVGTEGSVAYGRFQIGAQQFVCTDSKTRHGFTFTPSFSVQVQCESMDEIDRLFAALAERGSVLMPLSAYPFSERFGWVADRFGISWQLTLGTPRPA